jgi:hypothetical protein
MSFCAAGCLRSPAAENARFVRKNPEDSGLEKLRARQVVRYEKLSHDSGPR